MSNSLQSHRTVAHQPPLSFTTSQSLLKFRSKVGNVIQSSHPLSPPSPPALSLAQHQGLFQWVRSLHQVGKVLELQLQHSPYNEYSGLIFFRIDWFDLFAVQGTLKSSPATQFESINSGAQPSLWSNSHICIWLLEKPQLWLYGPLLAKWYLCSKQWKFLGRNYSTLNLNNTSDSISRRNVPWPHLSLIPDVFQIMRVTHTGSRPLWSSICVKICNLNFWTSNIQSHFRIMKTVKLCQVEVH